MKLDRFLAKQSSLGRTAAHRLIAAGRVHVDGVCQRDGHHEVDRFARIMLDGQVLQTGEARLHFMMHKPVGILSATSDPQHPTVLDLMDHPAKETLHLAGRLDRGTSGLVLLTNDGHWSRLVTEPEVKVPKVYLVETAEDIPAAAIEAFAQGFYFHTEDLTTQPAILEILAPRQARLTLYEGRYHQVKRMFHRIQNRVVALHRESIGRLSLPPGFPPGAWRALTAAEIDVF